MRIHVANLSGQVTDARFMELASMYGKPDSANIAKSIAGGASKGFGFIEYRTNEEGLAAIKGLDGKVVEGQALKVRQADSLKARPWSAAAR